MSKKYLATLIIPALFLANSAVADGFSLYANLGYAMPKFSNGSADTWMNAFMENRYSINSDSQNEPLFGIGAAYNWAFNSVAFNLGASAYYLRTSVSGINSPFINIPTLSAPTLDYNVIGHSYAIMLEPKFILTEYTWQPYILGGAGLSYNRFSGYTENSSIPGSGASPTKFPFTNKSTSQLAYELGIGIQHYFRIANHTPILALDYRYINWGDAKLGNTASTPSNNLSFGELYTTAITLSLIWLL